MQAKKYLVLFVALILTNVADVRAQYNPYWQWAKADTINTSAVSNAGSVLAVKNGKALWGHMTAVKRFNGIEPMGNYNLTEFDSTGKQLNVSLLVGNVQLFDAQADAAGNWYVLGRFYDTLLFSGMTTPYIRTNAVSSPDADHFMVRFAAGSMAISWVKMVGPLATVSSRAFTLDNNKLYIAADSLGYTVVRSMSFATGDATTLFRQAGTSTSSSIQVDAAGGIYLAGSCSTDGLDFNGASEAATSPQSNSYIVKYRSNGTHVWHQWMLDNSCYPRKLTLYNNRFLYYTGNLRDSFFIGSQFLHRSVTPDFVAARLDTSGNLIWARQNDTTGGSIVSLGDQAYHAVVTPDTALVMFAEGSGYIYWGDTMETNLQNVNAATLVSVGPNNKVRWVRPIYAEYTINQHIATEGLAVWVTGNAYSQTASVMLDTLRLRVPARKYTAFLAKTKLVRPIPVNPTSGVGGMTAGDLAVYPIPVHTTLQVGGLQGACTLTLSDITGRAVRTMTTAAGTQQTNMDVAELPRGAYVLTMQQADGARVVRKIILQ